jgi:DNA-directed RNA polymerase I subunit RPA43
MSIDQLPEESAHKMDGSPSRHKSEKKHKSKEEKKRKRDEKERDDSKHHRSKKARQDSTHAQPKLEDSKDSVVANVRDSPFHTQTASFYLSLAPITQRFPLEGACAEHLSPLILTYYPPLRGVVLSYSNARIAEEPLGKGSDQVLVRCVDEYGPGYVWVTAEFLIFKPQRMAQLEGYINLQNEGHLGIVCWNLFNASIERQRLPKDWKWVSIEDAKKDTTLDVSYAEDGAGHFVDGEGKKVEGMVQFKVKDIESSHDRERGFLSIQGTMLDDEAEKELLEREYQSSRTQKDAKGRIGGARGLGATSLGIPVERNDEREGERRHRHQY